MTQNASPLPLDQLRLDWPPRMICLIMTFIATLALCMQATLGLIVEPWKDAGASQMTVEVVPLANEQGEALQSRIQDIVSALRAMPAVRSADLLSEARIRDLLAPWLLNSEAAASIPLPVLIDVAVQPGENLDPADLMARLPLQGQGVQINNHAALAGGLIGFAFLVQLACWGVLVLTVITLMLAVVTVCCINLEAQKPTIELVQLLGGTDQQIAQMFARFIHRICVPSSLAGFGLGLLLASIMTAIAHAYGFHQMMLAGLSPWFVAQAVLAIALVPLFMMTAAPFAARTTIRTLLRQQP